MKTKYFRIAAPFTRVEDVKLLKQAGADELYCGFVTRALMRKWPSAFLILNRRGEKDSFEEYETFKKAVEQARSYDLPVFVTLNGIYTPDQYPLLLDLVAKIECLKGIKGVIVSDLAFLLILRKNSFGKEIHISTGGTCFNSLTADFYQKLGANRVILDRQLTEYEIKSILKTVKTKIDIEIFIINESCWFIDGFCNFFHSYENIKHHKIKRNTFLCRSYNVDQALTGCDFIFLDVIPRHKFKVFNTEHLGRKERFKLAGKEFIRPLIRNVLSEKIFGRTRFLTSERNYNFGCRICDLYELNKEPMKILKIVGRGLNCEANVKSVRFISQILDLLSNKGITKKDYKQRCKDLFSEIILNKKRKCSKFDCYFSTRWLKK